MAKPTHASVTGEPCACHYLERMAGDRRSPIVYDPKLNEYNFEYPSPWGDGSCEAGKASLRIYHCPFCGGAAPESKRGLLFSVITPEEQGKLYKLFGSIKTMDDALRVFGPPDDDNPRGLTKEHPEREGTAPTVETFRTLRYSGLSETVDVHLAESRTGGVHLWLQGKYLGPPPDGEDQRNRESN